MQSAVFVPRRAQDKFGAFLQSDFELAEKSGMAPQMRGRPSRRIRVGVGGIEPSTSRSQTERSTDELHSVFTAILSFAVVKFNLYNQPS